MTIPDLQQGTEYEVVAAYMNRDGFDLYLAGAQGAARTLIPVDSPESRWRANLSHGGVGRSQSITVTAGGNDPPRFPAAESGLRSIAENAAPGMDIGAPVAAEDPESDTLTYSLGGTAAASFDIETSSGQLRTKASLDFETKSSYSVTVNVLDGKDADSNTEVTPATDNSIDVTITETDVDEPPPAPDAPTVRPANSGGDTSLAVSWAEPFTGGIPAISGYDLRYILASADDSDDSNWTELSSVWTSGDQKYTITGLSASSSYEVQVRAVNDEETGAWSSSAEGTTDSTMAANNAPEFDDGTSAMHSVDENTASGEDIGTPVSATDADDTDTLTYGLGGTDAGDFDIDATNGQLKSKSALNYESKDSYIVTLTVRDRDDANDPAVLTDSIDVTISVTDLDEPPGSPGAPPVVAATTGGDTGLDVTWIGPSTARIPAITSYDLRYILANADESDDANWTVRSDAWTAGVLEYTITGLSPSTTYKVQVRAINDEGIGGWSSSGQGTTNAVQQSPPAPTNLTADATHDAVTLRWEAPDDATVTGYQILRKLLREPDLMVHVADTGNTNLEYVDTNVDPETTYVYRVKAINPTGVGPQSNFIRIKTAPAP